MVMIHETCRLYPYTIGLCHPAYRPFLALAMTCRAARVLEGGINMRNRSNLRCHLRLSMRRADTYGLHLVVLYACYIPVGIHVSKVESLSRRLVPVPYERPVVLSGLRLLGCRVVAACHCSLGYTPGVPILVCTFQCVVFLRVG